MTAFQTNGRPAVQHADHPADGEAGEAVVELRGVSKTFRDFWYRPRVKAVHELDLTVRRGEVLGLLGPNGSGKSTTIKMVLGLLYPTRGRIAVLGRPPTDVSLKRRIGYLPEDSTLYRFLNAEETLDFYGRLFKLGAAERKARVESLLDMVGLRASRYRAVGEMSKGMKRRVALAQALINDPDLLILDEPTAGMDPIAAREVKDLIHALKRRGKTVILCTHLLGDVEDVCDRLAIMYGGKLRREGPADDLLRVHGRQTIETEELSAEEVERVRQALAASGKQVAGVRPSRRRLEELFLDVIHDAEAAGDQTTGAAIGGQVADFLAEERAGDAVLEQLAAPRPVTPVQSEPTPEPEPAGVDAATLAEVAEPAPPPPPAAPREVPPQDADEDVLQELTGRRE